MRISDEIREWCKWCDEHSAARDELCKLADRIDREMLELPHDADGIPIHVWDTVYDRKSGSQMEVRSMSFNGQWHLTTNKGHINNTSLVAYEMPDSFERIADDLEKWLDEPSADWDDFKKARALVDRIRKLAKKEDK